MPSKKSLENLKKGKNFTKNDPRINKKGAPPKLLRHFNEELNAAGYERVTVTQVAEAFELLFNLPEQEIDKITEDHTRPYFLRKVAGIMGTARGIDMIESMLDRVHGRAVQKTEVTGKDGQQLMPDSLSHLSFDELYRLKYGRKPD